MKKILLLFVLLTPLLQVSKTYSQTFEVYVSDAGGFDVEPWQILRSDGTGDSIEVFTNEELAWPQDVVILEDQSIAIVSNLSSGRITKYNITDGTYVGNFATDINGPTRMKIGADSLLYVLEWANDGQVKRYELDGTFVDNFTSNGVNQSIGMDWDSEGNLYVSSWTGGRVERFDTSGNSLGNFISSGLQGPTNITFLENGELLVLNWNGSTAKRFDADGNFIDDYITGLGNPEGIAFFPNGNILVGNGGTSAVKLFDSEGNFIEDFIPSETLDLILPNGVTVREIPDPVSVSNLNVETKFIQPTIGSAFYLSPSAPKNIDWIEIYTSSGTLVERRQLLDYQIWNSIHYPEGIYFITAKSTEGDFYTQKVFVKR